MIYTGLLIGLFSFPITGESTDITSIRQLRNLTPSELRNEPIVFLRGSIVHVNAVKRELYLQDEFHSIVVHWDETAPLVFQTLKLGDLISLRGIARPGEFTPVVHAKFAEVMDSHTLPEPLPYNLNANDSRWLDGHFVSVVCDLLNAKIDLIKQETQIEITANHRRTTLILPYAMSLTERQHWLGRTVKISGVCKTIQDEKKSMLVPQILCNDVSQWTDLNISSDETLAMRLPIEELQRYLPSPFAGHRRVIVDGIVVAQVQNRISIQNQSHGIVATLASHDSKSLIGHRVRVTGLLDFVRDTLELTSASVFDLGAESLPTPRTISSHEIANDMYLSTRVEVSGVIHQQPTKGILDGELVMILHAEGQTLNVVMPELDNLAEAYPIGTYISIVGVLNNRGPWPKSTLGLIVNSPKDITLLDHPVDRQSMMTKLTVVAMSILGITVFMISLWLFFVRRTLARQRKMLIDRAKRDAELAQKLQQSQKMEAIGRLAGGIAHDFNNLLTVINGASEILPEIVHQDPDLANELSNDIRAAGTKAAGLVSQLLMFSRQRTTQLAPLDLNDVIGDTEKMLRRVIGEDVKIFTIKAPKLPSILGEPTLLHQIIVNIAVNARDAMPNGGTVTIASRTITLNGKPTVRLSVSDTGCGMTPEVREKIFEPFFTTKEIGKGTGLGLSIVFGIVRTLNGQIHIDSEVDRGTTFEIDFPAVESVIGSSTEVLTYSKIIKNNSRKSILLVEDDDSVRSLTTRILEMQGYRVQCVDDPVTALEMIEKYYYDLIITDVVMPGMGGRELAAKALEQKPNLNFLFMSGYTADEVLRRGVQEDEVDFINKPFTSSQLGEKIQEIFKRLRKPAHKEKSSLFKMSISTVTSNPIAT